MKKIIAGTMLMLVILLGAFGSSVAVHASATNNQAVTTEASGDEGEDANESPEVLGEKREQTDKFILVIEIAISLTFAIGLIAASHGAEVK